jgi:hypothetical protein
MSIINEGATVCASCGANKKLETTGCLGVLLNVMFLLWLIFGPGMMAIGMTTSGYTVLIIGAVIFFLGGALLLAVAQMVKQETIWYRKQT